MKPYPWTELTLKEFSMQRFRFVFETNRHLPYLLGGKVASLSDKSSKRGIDCSGLVRWLWWHAANWDSMPDGSYHQYHWCMRQGFKLTAYKHAELEDDRLRIAFIYPKAKQGIVTKHGHVWFVRNGITYESYGSEGVGSRNWNAKPISRPDACFVLTQPVY